MSKKQIDELKDKIAEHVKKHPQEVTHPALKGEQTIMEAIKETAADLGVDLTEIDGEEDEAE